MRLALVNKHLRLGGIETVVQQLWRGLPARGIAADLWVAEYGSRPAPGVRLMYPPALTRLSRSRLAPWAARAFPRRSWGDRIFRQLLRSDHEVVHVHGFDATYASLESLVELAHAKPVALTLHGSWFFTGGCGQPLGCERFTDGCGRCPQAGRWPIPTDDDTAEALARKRRLLRDAPIHFVSPARHLRADALRSAVGRAWTITHIPNGVDTTTFRGERKHDATLRRACGVDPDRFVVLAACRDFRDETKGTDLLIEALRMTAADDLQVVLVGHDADAVARALPSSIRPLAKGYVENDAIRRDLFEVADVLLFTSRAETFPCVVLEAMSAECCVVSTPLAGVIEQVRHEATGLVADGFSGAAIARELARAAADRTWTAQLGRRARGAAVERFSEAAMIAGHAALYEGMRR